MDTSRTKDFSKNLEGKVEDGIAVVQDTAHKAGAQAAELGGRVYQQGRRAGQSLGQAFGQQPLGTVLVAAALGYGIAYLVHRR